MAAGSTCVAARSGRPPADGCRARGWSMLSRCGRAACMPGARSPAAPRCGRRISGGRTCRVERQEHSLRRPEHSRTRPQQRRGQHDRQPRRCKESSLSGGHAMATCTHVPLVGALHGPLATRACWSGGGGVEAPRDVAQWRRGSHGPSTQGMSWPRSPSIAGDLCGSQCVNPRAVRADTRRHVLFVCLRACARVCTRACAPRRPSAPSARLPAREGRLPSGRRAGPPEALRSWRRTS